ncbi:hypothetical protein L3X38_017498 [Prunus dulcis]|uniref:CCHC-type domain-containing protein n=1 Tax=Prunus dulcis TaxID=3755 RepID=A0AAD4Z975_PRUDU|nr:hypothetical protein L3X38_017498 [Prunus dulcis]
MSRLQSAGTNAWVALVWVCNTTVLDGKNGDRFLLIVLPKQRRSKRRWWSNKVRVQIGRLEENLFMFSFLTKEDRLRILGGGPWTFNHFLVVLAEADGMVQPSRIPLIKQEFWVQLQGLPPAFMTQIMGRQIGEVLGDHITSYQNEVVRVEIRYEKRPHTCYLCGRLDHMEKECSKYTGEELTDLDKPYGKWFQEDVFGLDYRRLPRHRFGLASKPWSMRTPATVED